MSVEYTKSLSDDFSGSLNISQFYKEITDSPDISPSCITVKNSENLIGNDVYIIFDSSLSSPEQTTLDTLISNHTPSTPIGSQVMSLSISIEPIESEIYITCMSFIFKGTEYQNITNFEIFSFIEEFGTSYDIRLIDMTNMNEICNVSFTNEDGSILDLGTISNLPKDKTLIELQLKVNGSAIAHIKNLTYYYD